MIFEPVGARREEADSGNGEAVLEIPTWNTRSVVWTRSGMVHIDLIKLSIGIASNLFQFPGHFMVKREKKYEKR